MERVRNMASKKQAAPAEIDRTGLYKNGSRWWIRLVRSPISGVSKALSTGTEDIALAALVRDEVRSMCEGSEKQREWIDRAVSGEVKLLDLYNRAKRGELTELGEQLKAAKTQKNEVDLDQVVTDWVEKDLNTREDCKDFTKECYEKQVRYFIPAGTRFPRAKLTEQYVRDMLKALKGAAADKTRNASGGTKRNYLVGLQQFVAYALRKEVLTVDPLRFAFGKHGWAPKRRARSVYHEYPRVRQIIAKVNDTEAHAALAMIFGSGIELGGLLDQKAMHIGDTLPDGRGKIIVPGQDSSLSGGDRKNDFRSERTIIVDKWAWEIVLPYVKSLRKLPKTQLWSWKKTTKGKRLRDIFYRAQIAAGFIEEPERTAKGNMKWNTVQPHTLHDARHSYCINRSLGLDGEPPRSAGFCSRQLGHASEQMVISIYKKAGIEDQVRTLEMKAAMEEAARVAVAGGAR